MRRAMQGKSRCKRMDRVQILVAERPCGGAGPPTVQEGRTVTISLRSIAKWALVVLAVGTVSTQATNYSVWVKGRGAGGAPGSYQDFSYWGPSTVAAGINKVAANWDGRGHIATENYRLRDALDCYCTGTNWCYVAAYSAGDLMIGYALDLYGASTRNVKDPILGATAGVCLNHASGAKQTGWNIKWVRVAAGAAGGSELANVGAWATSEDLVSDLKTGTARAMYDHNDTHFTWFYMYAGAKGASYSAVLPGQDDEVIAYHSSGAISGSSGGSYCNPSDWFCNDLTYGTAAAQGGRAKWAYHSVVVRDDAEIWNHYTNGNWGGIVGRMRQDMVTYAQ
jgi:hypothetical protein